MKKLFVVLILIVLIGCSESPVDTSIVSSKNIIEEPQFDKFEIDTVVSISAGSKIEFDVKINELHVNSANRTMQVVLNGFEVQCDNIDINGSHIRNIAIFNNEDQPVTVEIRGE